MAKDGGEGTFDREPDAQGWAKDGYTECSLPTETPSVSRGDLLKPLSMLTASNLDHPYEMPKASNLQNLSGDAPRLTQNKGEYKKFSGDGETFKDQDDEWARTDGGTGR